MSNVFLAVDVGNSRVKCGLFDGGKLESAFDMVTDPTASVAAYRHSLRQRLKDASPTAAGVSSVVKELSELMVDAIRSEFMVLADLIGAETDAPFRVDYSREALGPDRLCAAAGAWSKYGIDDRGDARPLIVVDAGTAVNYEVIVDGVYRGGAISAGPDLSGRALARGTSRIADIHLAVPDHAIGGNTGDAVRSGIMLGFIDGVAGMVDRMIDELDSDRGLPADDEAPAPFVIVTGGHGQMLIDNVSAIHHHDPALVLDGIRVLAS